MSKFLIPILLFISPFLPPGFMQADFIEELNAFFKAGDSKEIAKKFNSSIDLRMLNTEDVYSKVQAEQILRDFFSKHAPQNATVVHLINTNPNVRFGILNLQTKKGNYRISITSKKVNTAFLITELRIDPEK